MLLRPSGYKFKVTAKGGVRSRRTVQWGLLWKVAAVWALTLGALVAGSMRGTTHGADLANASVNYFWSYYNLVVLAVAALVCVELPRRRAEELGGGDGRHRLRRHLLGAANPMSATNEPTSLVRSAEPGATGPPQGPPVPGPEAYFAGRRGKLSLWAGVLVGPVVWALQLQAGYALSRFSHEHRWLTGVHHAVAALSVLIVAGALVLAWRNWQRLGRGQPRGLEDGIPGRSRFMAVLGMFTSALFGLLILAQWIPVFLIDPGIY